jgi:bifunctional non-homologous end joining protein LigD
VNSSKKIRLWTFESRRNFLAGGRDTKGDLANFYEQVFPSLQPYVQGRIQILERCPDGVRGECFYQREIPKGMPAGTPTKRLPNKGGSRAFTNYVVGGSLETQIALVNLGCIPVRVTGSRAKTFPKPDRVCLDIDPRTRLLQEEYLGKYPC